MAFVSATKKTGRFTPIIRHALLIGAAFVMLYPLLWMIGSSFKPESMIFSNPMIANSSGGKIVRIGRDQAGRSGTTGT